MTVRKGGQRPYPEKEISWNPSKKQIKIIRFEKYYFNEMYSDLIFMRISVIRVKVTQREYMSLTRSNSNIW